jgi:hypothetical protein
MASWLTTFRISSPSTIRQVAIICLLCALAAYFIKEYLARPPMIIFVYRCSLPAQVLRIMSSTFLKFIQTTRLEQRLMWTLMAAICGTIAGIGLIIGAVITKERLRS